MDRTIFSPRIRPPRTIDKLVEALTKLPTREKRHWIFWSTSVQWLSSHPSVQPWPSTWPSPAREPRKFTTGILLLSFALSLSTVLPSHSLSSFVRWYRGYVASSSLHARCTPIDGRFARRAQCFPLRRRTMRRSRGFSTYPSAGKVENGVSWFGKKRLTSRQMTRLASFKGGLCILISLLWRMSLFVSLSLSFSLFLVFLCSTFRTIRSILWMMEDMNDGTCIFVRFFRAWISSFFLLILSSSSSIYRSMFELESRCWK